MRPAFRHRFRDTNATLTLGGISPTEKVIAFCRVLLATTTFAIMLVDPKAPLWPVVAYPLLAAYVAVSLAARSSAGGRSDPTRSRSTWSSAC
jgi:hypothetical protein